MAAVGTKLAVQVVETMKKTIMEVEDVVDAGGIVTTIPATEAKAGGAGEGQHQHIPMATLLEVRVGGLLYLHPLSSPKGTTTVVAPGLGRIATLRPPPPRARLQGPRLPGAG